MPCFAGLVFLQAIISPGGKKTKPGGAHGDTKRSGGELKGLWRGSPVRSSSPKGEELCEQSPPSAGHHRAKLPLAPRGTFPARRCDEWKQVVVLDGRAAI